MRHSLLPSLALAAGALTCPAASHAQLLETETARLLRRGWLKLETSYEFQTSAEGTEAALPFGIEYGATNRLELMLEPVPLVTIRPNGDRHVTGVGDLEATLTYALRAERGRVPAVAIAAEAKFPTARDPLIGTRATDYTAYVIASERLGHVDAHAHFGYTIVGDPPGANLNNVWNLAAAVEYFRNQSFELYAEALGSTASAPEGAEGDRGPNVLVPEAAGGEFVASAGVAYRPARNVRLSVGVSYDNTSALQLRPSVAVWLR